MVIQLILTQPGCHTCIHTDTALINRGKADQSNCSQINNSETTARPIKINSMNNRTTTQGRASTGT